MKKATIVGMLLLGVLTSFGQASCDKASNNTFGIHYTYSPQGHGLGFEIGWTGQESPINFHINMDVFKENHYLSKEAQDKGDIGYFGRVYQKFGVRVARVPYKWSIYVNLLGGLDSNTGFYCGTGIKFLVPLNTKAISVEPMYVNKEFNVQATLHFIII